ncbi:PLP-dependent transferase [Wolfiporia cocos MD-104 SS10]|uniref:PLP-dependent transferase n=1 Tax=Wolfiporia cocos (strain MD-104) TaxID=742152 RepID=A0A2H3JRW7_WOLCO|nr:PLP-dependent transferase [Wolfiporia cocos MD-104 SS10]
MSLLFKHLRVHQIFGANTDVGKTILTTALVRASAARGIPVHYLKPVSTGHISDADDKHIDYFVGDRKANVDTACLFRFDEPVSPHLAVRMAQGRRSHKMDPPTDDAFVNAVSSHIRECAMHHDSISHMYVETAGGVHSPTLSGTTQVDCYRPLFLPTVLIGDSHLGGISTTISSYESLVLRGYIIDMVLLFHDGYYRNWEYLKPYFADRGIHVLSFDAPHKRLADPDEENALMKAYYAKLVPENHHSAIYDALDHLDQCHARRLAELESMPKRTLDTIWWPFVQHGHVKGTPDVNVIDSASQDFFTVYNGQSSSTLTSPHEPPVSLLEPQFDGSASWWTQALGHARPELTLAAAHAAGRYGHVMFPQATHLPALRLAERLVHEGPGKGWAARAFFSDDGSTGMEVALKMALRVFSTRQGCDVDVKEQKKWGILGLKGSYHGDTIGAMDACEEGVYTCEWHEAKGIWLDPPTVANRKGSFIISLPPAIAELAGAGSDTVRVSSLQEAYAVESRIKSPLAQAYECFIEQTLKNLKENGGPTIAALVLEPLVMGAGGMIFVDPLFQRVLIDVVRRELGLPVIFDEVFAGLYRLGMRSSGPLLGVQPDISVHAKILTGGLVPLAVTLASDSIFRAFMSDKKIDALLHGHSYTAYPLGCEVANKTLDIVEKIAASNDWDQARVKWNASVANQTRESSVWSFWDPEFVDKVARLSIVSEVMALGTVLAIKIRDDAGGYQSHSAQKLLASIKYSEQNNSVSAAPGGSPFGINYRTLGDVAYFMSSLNTPVAVVRSIQDRIWVTLTCT